MLASDLTDEATFRAFRPTKRTDDDTVAKIGFLISAMSAAVRRYTQRQLLGKTLGDGFDPAEEAARTFVYDGSGYLSLAPLEARSISSVVIDGVAASSLLEADASAPAYLAQPPQQTDEGTYLYLTLPVYRSCVERDILVTVTGTWGIVDVPADVELAVLHAVANAYGNPEGVASRTLGDGLVIDQGSDDVGGSLPREARNLLAGFVRRR